MITELEQAARDAAFSRGIRRFFVGENPMSSQPCGCDPEENWLCDAHRTDRGLPVMDLYEAVTVDVNTLRSVGEVHRTQRKAGLPSVDAERKALPIFTGVLMYFPDAILEVAKVSRLGNEQHNPGEPLHWAREKSIDQMNTTQRHMMDHGMGNTKDTDGAYHLAKAIWRLCAELQLTIEKEQV